MIEPGVSFTSFQSTVSSPWNKLIRDPHLLARLDLDCMSAVRSTGNATEQSDDDLEEGGQGAFGQLVLPPGHKKMVLSLISQHFRNKESKESNDKQLDIVRGKGKFLLAHAFVLLVFSVSTHVLSSTSLTEECANRQRVDHSATWSTRCGENNNRRYVFRKSLPICAHVAQCSILSNILRQRVWQKLSANPSSRSHVVS